jgi:hypothetical protein
MAKLWFINKGEDVNPETIDWIHATKTSDDESYIYNRSSLKSIEISDSEYDSLFDGTKFFRCSGGVVTFIDSNISTLECNRDIYERDVVDFKNVLQAKVNTKTNHSKIAEANATLNFVKNIDFDALTYPVTPLRKTLKDNNLYLDLACF